MYYVCKCYPLFEVPSALWNLEVNNSVQIQVKRFNEAEAAPIISLISQLLYTTFINRVPTFFKTKFPGFPDI